MMCATAFYLMENYPLEVGPEFSASVIQMCGVMLSGSEESTPSIIYHCALRGLERLLLSEQLSRLDTESLVKLSVDRVNVQSPHRAMAALGLMLTCMYTGKEKASPGRASDPSPATPDSESVIVAMERVSVLFDRIRKGFPCEARVVARILPQFLDDFFPPQDVMNKVIGEFLSNQQPYPQFMTTVVYKGSLLPRFFRLCTVLGSHPWSGTGLCCLCPTSHKELQLPWPCGASPASLSVHLPAHGFLQSFHTSSAGWANWSRWM